MEGIVDFAAGIFSGDVLRASDRQPPPLPVHVLATELTGVRAEELGCTLPPKSPVLEITVYGRTVTVRAYVIEASWYVASGSEVVRLVLVRDFPGRDKDDVLVCTDPTLSKRRSLKVKFHDAKGKLGVEDPQNRTERAVERTAPVALIGYSLTVLRYMQQGHRSAAARLEILPWYTHEAGTTFSDMLAPLRRASWRERLFDPA